MNQRIYTSGISCQNYLIFALSFFCFTAAGTFGSLGNAMRFPPGVFQNFSPNSNRNVSSSAFATSMPSNETVMFPLQNQLRLEAALAGMNPSLISGHMLPTTAVSSMIPMDPYLAAARQHHSMNASFGINRGRGSTDYGFLTSSAGAPVVSMSNTAPEAFPHDNRGMFTSGSDTSDQQRITKSPTKCKRRSSKKNKHQLDSHFTDYLPGLIKELSLPSDRENLSAYQCLLRKQIYLFAVQTADIQCSAQGRNKPITLGQVGVLCRHCAKIPPGLRPCGAVYFPGKLAGLYQASQNMAINHFTKSCRNIPKETRHLLMQLKEQKASVLGGGKHFWANGARVVGIYETEDGTLKFRDGDEKCDLNNTNDTNEVLERIKTTSDMPIRIDKVCDEMDPSGICSTEHKSSEQKNQHIINEQDVIQKEKDGMTKVYTD